MTAHRMIPWTQDHTVSWFGPGNTVVFEAGDIILWNTPGTIAKGIRAGEWIIAHTTERELGPYTWTNHAAFGRFARVNQADPTSTVSSDVAADGSALTVGTPIISQMGPKLFKNGHQYAPAEGYLHNLAAVIHFNMDDNDRQYLLAADDGHAFIEYGFASYPFLAISGLTGVTVGATLGSSEICSTHVTECANNLCLRPDRPASAMMPSHIALLCHASPFWDDNLQQMMQHYSDTFLASLRSNS